MATPIAVETSREGFSNLPGVNGQKLEFRQNVSLYSTLALDNAAAPLESVLFNYSVGQTVSGAGNGAVQATSWHTNMRVPRTLPSPEVFVLDRVRFHMPALSVGASNAIAIDQTYGATGAVGTVSAIASNNAADLLAMTLLHARLEVEGKRYVDAPLWMLPGNCGVGGVHARALSSAVSTATNAVANVQALHWVGEGWRFSDSMPPILTSNTVLDFRLFNQTTGYAFKVDRYLQVILQGTHGRAVR
jgi:hypothetical protein